MAFYDSILDAILDRFGMKAHVPCFVEGKEMEAMTINLASIHISKIQIFKRTRTGLLRDVKPAYLRSTQLFTGLPHHYNCSRDELDDEFCRALNAFPEIEALFGQERAAKLGTR